MNPWLVVLTSVFAVLGGGGGLYSALTVGATRRKMLAEADSVAAKTMRELGEANVELMAPLRGRVRELEQEVDDLRRKVRTLTREVEDKTREIESRDRVIMELRRVNGQP